GRGPPALRPPRPPRPLARSPPRRPPPGPPPTGPRRCNLSCGYCTEYDDHSPEVPYDVLRERIDALHRLGVLNIAMLGGEPLLHSRIADVIAYANRRAQVSVTTNGFLVSDRMIDELNRAGLANMQVSIDAVRPDPTGYLQKTLKPLKPKLDPRAPRAGAPGAAPLARRAREHSSDPR